jgi:hypothetical protein
MDTMRGNFGSLADTGGYDAADEEPARELPPLGIGQDERRMQVRAYNHWAGLLESRNFPAIEDLEPENLPDFGPYSVLLDFTSGIENPGISFLGDKLAIECGVAEEELTTLADVPSRSLLTRITDHYMQILANQAPIGFEAEFVNQRGSTILYRGILLPYSTDDDTIDFIFGVINWKELADSQSSDELLLEVDQALEQKPLAAPVADATTPLTDWADGPGAVPANDSGEEGPEEVSDEAPLPEELPDEELPTPSFGTLDAGDYEGGDVDEDEDEDELPRPSFGLDALASGRTREPIRFDSEPAYFAPELPAYEPETTAFGGAPAEPADEEVEPVVSIAIDVPHVDPADMELGDWLAVARETAAMARTNEDRTRNALYDAIGQAYDFSLAAAAAPDEFGELLADSGLTFQDRAPMTPVVKLVFGADYDKTRLTEYAAALSHAHRLGLGRGSLCTFLSTAEGGLKGVVKAERRLRKEEAGKEVEAANAPKLALAKKLRAMPAQDFAAIGADGAEFALVMIRRSESGEVEMIGEVPEDVALVERAARRLIG